MKMRFFTVFFAVFLAVAANCQETMEGNTIFGKNLNSLYQDPDQTIKVANYLFENASSNPEKAKALYLLSESKMLKGNTVAGIEDLFKAKEILNKEDSPYISSLVLIAISKRCRLSGMDDISSTYLEKAENLSKKIKTEEEMAIVRTLLFQEQARVLTTKNNFEEALQKLKQIEIIPDNLVPALQAITKNELADAYLSNSKIDRAESYFKESLLLLKNSGLENSTIESISLQGLGNVYFQKNELEVSKKQFKQALQLSIIEKPIKSKVLTGLFKIYKTQDSLVLFQKYYNENTALNASMIEGERDVRSTIFSHIDTEQQKALLSDKKGYYKWGVLLAVLFLIALIGYYFYNKKLDKEYKRFKEVIAQVEKDKKLEAPYSIDDSTMKPSKGITIPEETEQAILERLEEFEATTKFTNNNMSLNLLAKQLKTNSKYISEIIHNHKQKNFNTYINELRVNYIIQLMKSDKAYLNYKVSYLAETCGFSSHSAFTVVFKSITGFTPKQFVSFLKKSEKEKSATF